MANMGGIEEVIVTPLFKASGGKPGSLYQDSAVFFAGLYRLHLEMDSCEEMVGVWYPGISVSGVISLKPVLA
ncbi:MAG: hypothetical protein AB3K77_17010 [Methanosarcinaceae archaeon]